MSVNIILKTGGDTSSREYRDALKLKNIFEKSLSSNIYGDILIYSSAILFGQKIKDIDIICCGKFKNLNLNIKCRVENTDKQKKPSDKESNILIDEDDQKLNDDNQIKLRDVRIRDFIFCIENKSHPINQIVLDGLSLKVKYQNGKLHDASDQSEQQKYSLKSFLSDKWNSKKIPYICNFIWLTDVDPDSLKQLVGERDVDILKNNYLPSDFGLRWLFNLAAIQKIPIYSKKYPNPSLMSSYGENINNDKILKVFEEFNKFKEGSGVLTRKKIEKINKRLLKGQKYEKAIGEKLLIISGRAGTGKTLKLINIAFDLANFNNKRCLILTYNKALVSDIKRLLAIADISDDFSENTIEISTVHKFIYELIFAFGLTDKKFIEDFIVRYNSYLDEIYEYISEGALTKEDIQSLAVSKHQIISWDYVFIDESQDWITKEKDLLFKLFSSHNFIIADGVDQMVRKQSKCDWKNNLNDFHKISEKRCFRQKRNLVEFLNSYAEEFNLNWEVEPLEENIGGRIVISEIMNDYNLFIKEKELCFKEKNASYDFMFLVPPSFVTKNKGFNFVEEYLKHDFKIWDGTKKDVRTEYPTDLEEHRLLQYDSCRGLEAWTVVCLALDDLVYYKSETYDDEEIQESFFLQDKIKTKNDFIYLWSLIPLTRPMDTLIITLKNPASEFSKKLYNISSNFSDIVTWNKL